MGLAFSFFSKPAATQRSSDTAATHREAWNQSRSTATEHQAYSMPSNKWVQLRYNKQKPNTKSCGGFGCVQFSQEMAFKVASANKLRKRIENSDGDGNEQSILEQVKAESTGVDLVYKAKLTNTHIMQIYDYGFVCFNWKDDDIPIPTSTNKCVEPQTPVLFYTLSNKVPGKELETKLETELKQTEERLDVALQKERLDVALQVGLHVAEALQEMHTNNLVHRDIKPANIMWDEANKNAYIIDMGLVRNVTHPPGGGTKGFIPPEIMDQTNQSYYRVMYKRLCKEILKQYKIEGQDQTRKNLLNEVEPPFDSRTHDIFALGMTLSVVLNGGSWSRYIDDVVNEKKTSKGNLELPTWTTAYIKEHPDLICVILKAIHPRSRYATISELKDELEKIRTRLRRRNAAGTEEVESEESLKGGGYVALLQDREDMLARQKATGVRDIKARRAWNAQLARYHSKKQETRGGR